MTYDDATVTRHVSDSKRDLQQLHLVKSAIPIYGPVAGLVLVVLGALLLRGQRAPREPRVRRAPRPAPAEETGA